jgi:IclR family acetate operon transcriptional repressor
VVSESSPHAGRTAGRPQRAPYTRLVADSSAPRDDTVRSVDRALSILQILARRGPSGVSEVAQEVGIHKSTAFRMLATLESRGIVVQSQTRGEYRLGEGLLQLAAGVTSRYDITVTSRPTTERLAESVGETVNVAIHDGTAVISIDQHIGPAAVTTVNWVGQRSPLHASAGGKVFLAFPDPSGRPRVPDGLQALTPRTIVDPAALATQLGEVRDRGWSLSDEEMEEGLVAVGAPVWDHTGIVVAAVVVSGPAFRLTPEVVPDVAAQTVAAADEISHRNGVPKVG